MARSNPRVVVVSRETDYQRLIQRHGTRGQAKFFLASRKQSLEPLETIHAQQESTLRRVLSAVPEDWPRRQVDRRELDRFVFEPDDVVAAVGQDGLAANVAKYLDGQPVLGFNPSPERYDGVLVRHRPESAGALFQAFASGRLRFDALTMVRAELDDGRVLDALNEIFVGHRSHQSARYEISWRGARERHSSSGVIVSSGTGATGWARSVRLACQSSLELPAPTESRLSFFVREPFPSVSTGCELREGLVKSDEAVEIRSEMDDQGVIFGDGIESDRLEFSWGRVARLSPSPRTLHLASGAS